MTGHVVVDYQVGALPMGIYEGAPFEVDLSYDTATPDLLSNDPQRGVYVTGVGSDNFLKFRAGPAIAIANGLKLLIGNDIDGSPKMGDGRPIWDLPDDCFQSQSQIIANFSVTSYSKIEFSWRDPSRNIFHSDAMPSGLDLTALDEAWFEVSSLSPSSSVDQFIIRGIVTKIDKIPEPSTICLSAIGLFFFRGVAKRR